MLSDDISVVVFVGVVVMMILIMFEVGLNVMLICMGLMYDVWFDVIVCSDCDRYWCSDCDVLGMLMMLVICIVCGVGEVGFVWVNVVRFVLRMWYVWLICVVCSLLL